MPGRAGVKGSECADILTAIGDDVRVFVQRVIFYALDPATRTGVIRAVACNDHHTGRR